MPTSTKVEKSSAGASKTVEASSQPGSSSSPGQQPPRPPQASREQRMATHSRSQSRTRQNQQSALSSVEMVVGPSGSTSTASTSSTTTTAEPTHQHQRTPHQYHHHHHQQQQQQYYHHQQQPTASTSSSHPLSHSHSHSHYAHASELSRHLETGFVPSVVPSIQEYEAKENARIYLEGFVERIEQGAKLLPFGSIANGFALRNSDMDLCCFMPPTANHRSPSELVELLGGLIQSETNYHVKMLPRARIPIIKLAIPPSASNPFGLSCDIGFENRLALENTRLLLTYAMIDERLRTLVLFLKVWTKRRKINNPYRGTLSSYGYVLLVIHFLMHVKKPPVLPNLQQLPRQGTSGHNGAPTGKEASATPSEDISFFDDLDALSSVWQKGQNTEGVGTLLIDFFKYYAKDFGYANEVVSIRSLSGHVTKESKGWHHETEYDPDGPVRDLHKLCIEDPFQLDYNVARTVTKDGLFTIRGEFIRAFRLLTSRSSSAVTSLIAELCEEREDFLVQHTHPSNAGSTTPGGHSGGSRTPHASGGANDHSSPRRRSAPSPRMKPFTGTGFMQDMRWPGGLANGVAANQQMQYYGNYQQQQQHRGGAYPYSQQRMTRNQRSQPGVSRTSGYARHSTGNQTSASLERRVSWDGSQQSSIPTTTSGTVRTGATHRMTNYDLHRFFQNPPTASAYDPVPSSADASNRSNEAAAAGSTRHDPRMMMSSSSTTAPSSPQMHDATGSMRQYTSLMPPFSSTGPPPLPLAAGGQFMQQPQQSYQVPPVPLAFGSVPVSPALGPSPVMTSTSPLLTPPIPTSATFPSSPAGSVGTRPMMPSSSFGGVNEHHHHQQHLQHQHLVHDQLPPVDYQSYLPQPLTFGSLPASPSLIAPFTSPSVAHRLPPPPLDLSADEATATATTTSSSSKGRSRDPSSSPPSSLRSSQRSSTNNHSHVRRGADGKESILFGEIAVELPPFVSSDSEGEDSGHEEGQRASGGRQGREPPSEVDQRRDRDEVDTDVATPTAQTGFPPLTRTPAVPQPTNESSLNQAASGVGPGNEATKTRSTSPTAQVKLPSPVVPSASTSASQPRWPMMPATSTSTGTATSTSSLTPASSAVNKTSPRQGATAWTRSIANGHVSGNRQKERDDDDELNEGVTRLRLS